VISNVGASDPQGESVPAEGRDGVVLVELATPTPTLTRTLTPIPPTHFRTATNTTTPSQTPAPTATARRDGGGDGCAVIAPSAGGDWWLLLPLLVLARRRGRWDLKAVAPGPDSAGTQRGTLRRKGRFPEATTRSPGDSPVTP
jgi:hypothetical protein